MPVVPDFAGISHVVGETVQPTDIREASLGCHQRQAGQSEIDVVIIQRMFLIAPKEVLHPGEKPAFKVNLNTCVEIGDR